MNIPYSFETNKATIADIVWHLNQCSASFVPPLDTRVDIEAYSIKLHRRAVRFEARCTRGALAGLVAAYFNDAETTVAFVSSVSVLPTHQCKGLASSLVARCVQYAENNKFVGLELEVDKSNNQAIALYTKLGFFLKNEGATSIFMSFQF